MVRMKSMPNLVQEGGSIIDLSFQSLFATTFSVYHALIADTFKI